MSTIPSKLSDQLAFFEAHWPIWTDSPPSAIGLTAPQVAAFKDLVNSARISFDAAQTARNAAKSATVTQDSDMANAFTSCSELIRVIRAYAEMQANPATVYAAADVPPPANPQPAPAPGTPTNFTVQLLGNGAVRLAWKCSNPVGVGGTIYEVRRSIAGAGQTFVGAVGSRTFTDSTIPEGSTNVTYEITATRSTLRGDPATFNVNFGMGGGGFATASVKLAA